MKKTVKFLALLLGLVLLASSGTSSAEKLAAKEDVYATAVRLFESSWMPGDSLVTVLDDGEGLWNIRADDKETGEPAAYMQIDGDNENVVVFYRKASFALPPLDGLGEKLLPEEEQPASWNQWAKEVFLAFRGNPYADEDLVCVAKPEENLLLFVFGYTSDAYNILLAETPESPDGVPGLLAYADMHFNPEIQYDGYISLDEAFGIAVAACREKWPDLPDGQIVLNDSGFILFDTEPYYQEDPEDLPEDLPGPIWVIRLEDPRANPDSDCYDASVENMIYPVLVDPVNGNVIEIREPEGFGFG